MTAEAIGNRNVSIAGTVRRQPRVGMSGQVCECPASQPSHLPPQEDASFVLGPLNGLLLPPRPAGQGGKGESYPTLQSL